MLRACFKLDLHGHALQRMQWNVCITLNEMYYVNNKQGMKCITVNEMFHMY